MNKDPNGLVAKLIPVVTLVALVAGKTWDAEAIAAGIAGAIDLALILAARRKAWAPDTVRAISTAHVAADEAELPTVPLVAEVEMARAARKAA